MLRIEQVTVAPLPPLSFAVKPGECLAVEGPSGGGKSRLLRAIADLIPADGLVYLDNLERRDISGPEWRRKVRYLSSEPQWWTDTARAAFPVLSGPARERVGAMLAYLAVDGRMLDRSLFDLSSGERQRIAFVLALADTPPVMLLDDPTRGLDADFSARIEAILRSEINAGRHIILTSYDDGLISRISDFRLQLAAPRGAAQIADGNGRASGRGPFAA